MERSRRFVVSMVAGVVALGAAAIVSMSGPLVAVTAAAASTSSGCGTSVPAGSTPLTLSIGGHRRTVIVHVPPRYTKSTPAALVLNMHGTGSDALDQDLFAGMNFTSDADGFLVAYPQALIAYETGFAWNVPNEPIFGGTKVPVGSASDVKFLTSLVATLESRYCINKDEVYATGFSGGARMASQLACDSSGTFAAIAAVSGLRRPTPCPTTRPVPVIAFHGLNDQVDPYEGHGQAYWTYSVPTAEKDWAKQDHCSSKASTTKGRGYTLTTYSHCAKGSAVELYSITGEGHEWPGGPAMPASITDLLGPQSNAVNADALIWSFFEAHPL
jgi:polyhydroxybutyrate depolymerase